MKLYAYNITNLTDARYFAARGAAMIGFSTSLSTIEEVNAMKDWVDVPQFFLQIKGERDASFVWEWTDRTGIETCLISELDDDTCARFPNMKWMKRMSDITYIAVEELSGIILSCDELNQWEELVKTNNEIIAQLTTMYIPQELKVKEIENLNGVDGILISGSEEDKVGIKNYDELNDFLDQIDIEY